MGDEVGDGTVSLEVRRLGNLGPPGRVAVPGKIWVGGSAVVNDGRRRLGSSLKKMGATKVDVDKL